MLEFSRYIHGVCGAMISIIQYSRPCFGKMEKKKSCTLGKLSGVMFQCSYNGL